MASEAIAAKPQALANQCYRLIYRSHSLLNDNGKDEGGLVGILKQARLANAEKGITGALMLYDDWFAQVLEGPQAVIEALYARIKVDARHDGVRLTVTPPVPNEAQAVAQAKGRERYEGFIEALGRRIQKGQSLMDEIPEDIGPRED